MPMTSDEFRMTWDLTVMAFAATAAIADVWTRKVPRWLTVSGFIAGLAYHLFRHDVVAALGTATVGFVIGLALFSLGAIGGGDVKLITALGAMLGFHKWALAMEVSILVAGVMAVVQIIHHRAVAQTLRNLREILKGWFYVGLKAHPVLNVSNRATIRSPYALAVAVGTVVAVMKP